jgi:hypothetical protein
MSSSSDRVEKYYADMQMFTAASPLGNEKREKKMIIEINGLRKW